MIRKIKEMLNQHPAIEVTALVFIVIGLVQLSSMLNDVSSINNMDLLYTFQPMR